MTNNAISIEQQNPSFDVTDQTPGLGLLKDSSFPTGSIERTWLYDGPQDNYRYHNDAGGVGTYASFGARVRIWQEYDLSAIVDSLPADQLQYGIGCHYGFSGFTQCTLRVYQLDGSHEQLLEERLLQGEQGEGGGEGDDPENPNVAWHTLMFKPVEQSAGVQRVRVEFETPDRVGFPYFYLRAVHLSLTLPAFNGEGALSLVMDPDGLNYLQSTPPFMLCHGAAHALKVAAPADDAWVGQQFCVAWRQAGEAPAEYGLSAVPELNSNDSSEDRYYQQMSATGPEQWTLQGMDSHSLKSGEVMLGLGSYWHAPVFAVPVAVGDFRYEVAQLEWDGVIPIIELNTKTLLTAKVINPYAASRLPAGKEVIWSLNGAEYQRTQTDDQGEATLEYQAKAGDEGANNSVEFTVSCVDEFELASEAKLMLPVYLKTPWLEELDVLLDGEPVTEFEQVGVILTRGTEHTLTLKPKRADSFFIGQGCALRWPEGGEQLGIRYAPTDERKMDEQGLSWSLHGGNTSGFFDIQAVLAGLQVPLVLKGMQWSANLSDEAELQLDGQPVAADSAQVFLRTESRTLKLIPKAGSPLAQAEVEAWLTFVDGSLPEQRMQALPTYSVRRTLVAAGLEWSLEGAQYSGTFGLGVNVQGMQSTLNLDKCALISSALDDEVDVILDGTIIDRQATYTFRRKIERVLGLRPKPNSPLGELGWQTWLTFEQGSLINEKLRASPDFGSKREISAPAVEWSITGEEASGTFGLSLHVENYASALKLERCRLISTTLRDEVELTLGGAPFEFDEIKVVRRGEKRTLGIRPKVGGLLEDAELKVWLTIETENAFADLLRSEPDYLVQRQLTDDGLEWEMTGYHMGGGTWRLGLHVDDDFEPLDLGRWALLADQLLGEIAFKVGNAVVSSPDQALLLLNDRATSIDVFSLFGLAALQAKCSLSFRAIGDLTEDQTSLSSGYDVERELQEGYLAWELTGKNQSGLFGLNLNVEHFPPYELTRCVMLPLEIGYELIFTLDGELIENLGRVAFSSNTTYTLKVQPKPNSPLALANIPTFLDFISLPGYLPEEDVIVSPTFGGPGRILGAAGLSWQLTFGDTKGTFRMSLKLTGITVDIPMYCFVA